MRITRWGEYGILCCLYLAKKAMEGGPDDCAPVGAAEIAEQQAIPIQYTQQILHRLRRGGTIKSIRGPRGGFLLTKSPEATNLREVLLAAEGHTFEMICASDPVYDAACGTGQSCGLKNVWQDLQSAINTVLESKSLASVLRAYPSVVPPLGAKATYHLIGGPKRKSTPKEENEAREHSSKEQLAMEESAAEKSGLL